jgi:hypothetical protein
VYVYVYAYACACPDITTLPPRVPLQAEGRREGLETDAVPPPAAHEEVVEVSEDDVKRCSHMREYWARRCEGQGAAEALGSEAADAAGVGVHGA